MKKSFSFNPSSWFSNIYYRLIGKNHVYTLTNPDLGTLLSCFRGGYNEANMMLMFQTMPELFFCGNAVASRVSNGVYKLVDADGKDVTENKLWNKIIERPNWQFSFKEFIWHAQIYKDITGNRYGYAYAPSTMKLKHANIQSLWLLPSHYVTIYMKDPRPSYLTTISPADYIKNYHYNGGDTLSDILPEYIVHDIAVKMGDSNDIVTGKGISPYRAGEYPLSNLLQVYIARNVFYVKRGPLGAIVSAKTDAAGNVALTPEEKDEVVNDITQRLGLGGDQNPIAVSNQPLGWVKFGATINEMEPFKETAMSTAALCAIRGIPTALMPKDIEAKQTNYDIAERNLYENVIFTEAESMCQFLTKLGRFDELGYKVVVSFDHISALQDDALASAQALYNNSEAAISLYNNGHITQNEVRSLIGHEPITGGDNYIDESERLAINGANGLNPEQEPGNNDPNENAENGDKEKKGHVKARKRKKLRFFNPQPTA